MVHIVFWSSLCGFCTTDEGLQFMWAFSRTNAPTPRQLRLLVHRRNQRERDETEKRVEEERDGTGCSERYEPATYSVCGIIFCRFDVGLDNCIPLMEIMRIFKVNCDVHIDITTFLYRTADWCYIELTERKKQITWAQKREVEGKTELLFLNDKHWKASIQLIKSADTTPAAVIPL